MPLGGGAGAPLGMLCGAHSRSSAATRLTRSLSFAYCDLRSVDEFIHTVDDDDLARFQARRDDGLIPLLCAERDGAHLHSALRRGGAIRRFGIRF